MTFKALAESWLQNRCPSPHNESQAPLYCEKAGLLLRYPLAYFGPRKVAEIGPILVDGYFDWRIAQPHRPGFSCRRTADLELTACSSVFRWAHRRELVPSNPFLGRGLRQRENLVVHCAARAPIDADTVHRVASKLLASPASESAGFLFLFLSLTGCRCAELRTLRLDASAPGLLQAPGSFTLSSICVQRAKFRDRDGAIQSIPLQPAAQSLLLAWTSWHAQRHPSSPFWFPGSKPLSPLDPTSLPHALARACISLHLPKLAPHGSRAFFTKVMRSLLPDDRQVADLLGHTSTKLVERIYGRRTPSEARCSSFLPLEGLPAWSSWLNILENHSPIPS
jgi:integrase